MDISMLLRSQIRTAVKEGKVSYRPLRGEALPAPSKVKEYVVWRADHLDEPEVDLSIAFDHAPKTVAKQPTQGGSAEQASPQNQRQ